MFIKTFYIIVSLSTVLSSDLPILDCPKAFAPHVPPPITRSSPARLVLNIESMVISGKLNSSHDYEFWAFDGHVPGPFVRTRVGDYLQVTFRNSENSTVTHDIDFHAISGPGGGGVALSAEPGQSASGSFQLLYPGLYIYHCGTIPAPHHITNGLYGLILVEPSEGLPKVDREYYVMKSEFYTKSDPASTNSTLLKPNYDDGLDEKPSHIVFNGKVDSLTMDPIQAKTDDRVRIFFGNIGPNQMASFHIIGVIFDRVYREGDLINPPGRAIQTTLVPAGGATVVEFDTPVPGTFIMVDHSIFRILKGAVGYLKVDGEPRLDVYCPVKLKENNTCDGYQGEYVNKSKSISQNLLTEAPQHSITCSYRPNGGIMWIVFFLVYLGF